MTFSMPASSRRPSLRILGLCTALALLLGTVETPSHAKRRKGPPEVVESALSYAATDRQRSIQLLENALAGRRPDKDTPTIMLHAGEQRRLIGNWSEAKAWFNRSLGLEPNGVSAPAARLGIALAELNAGATSQAAMSVLSNVDEKAALDTQNADRYLYLAVDAAQRGKKGLVGTYSRKSGLYAQADPQVLARIQSTLQNLEEVPKEDIKPETVVEGPGGPYEKAVQAFISGDVQSARRFAQKATNDDDPLIVERANGMLAAMDGAPVRPDLITVLLPLSGRYKAVGRNVQEALEWGAGPLRLQVVDSGGTAETAVEALERAVLEQGTIAVVGPLLSDETEAVVAAAERLHVPLLSLSQSYEPEGARFAFQGMYTRTDQVQALLDFTMGQLGMTAFGMFSPDTDYGNDAVMAFEQGVLERGGTIRAKGQYSLEEPPSEDELEEGEEPPPSRKPMAVAPDFGTRVGGPEELQRLKSIAAATGGNPNTVLLPPLVDFHAIFIPESARHTPLATAALAYQEFPMGSFQPVKDGPKIPLLGLSFWNTEALISRGGRYNFGCLFPDVFSAAIRPSDDPVITEFKGAYGRTPTALEIAISDAGRLLAAAAQSRPADRGAFRTALLEASSPNALTGATGFDPETLRAKRNLQMLTFTRSEVAQVGDVPLHGAEPRPIEVAPELLPEVSPVPPPLMEDDTGLVPGTVPLE
ncbi:MAG: penicillin-binding protein activator [Myxococcota bacterium]